jgi:hypothetical protein
MGSELHWSKMHSISNFLFLKPVEVDTSIRRRYGGSRLGLTMSRQSRALPVSTNERYVLVDPEQTLQPLLSRYLPGVEVEAIPDIPSAVAALNRLPAQGLILNGSQNQDSRIYNQPNLPFGTPSFTCWMPGKHEAAIHLGVVEYLIKPISRDKLLASLANLGDSIKTILIVDDEEDELHLFARYLEADSHSYAILQVTDGQRALSMLRRRHPDVMLLDLTMPGMSGFQVLDEKRRPFSAQPDCMHPGCRRNSFFNRF